MFNASAFLPCLLLLVSFAFAIPLVSNQSISEPDDSQNGSALTQRSPFPIENCGRMTSGVDNILIRLPQTLTRVIWDIQGFGLDSEYGFRALFKDTRGLGAIKHVYSSIVSGSKVPSLVPEPQIQTAPRIACISPDAQKRFPFLKYDPWERCKSRLNLYARYEWGTKYIFLCPRFFWAIPIEPKESHCLSVKDNVFVGDSRATVEYQTYTIAHEMVKFYLGDNSLSSDTTPPASDTPNDLVQYDSQSSSLNPGNYVLYAAMVNQKCTESPDPSKPPFGPNLSGEDTPANNTRAAVPSLPVEDHSGNSTIAFPDGSRTKVSETY